MKVSEIIEHLNKADPDAEIVVPNGNMLDFYDSVRGIEYATLVENAHGFIAEPDADIGKPFTRKPFVVLR